MRTPGPGAFEAEDSARLGPDAGCWAPGRTPGLTASQFYPWRDRAEVLNIGFAPAGEGEVRVFVFWHQL